MNGEYKGKRHPPFGGSEASEAGRRGGRANGVKRRQKKAMREWALVMRDLPTADDPNLSQGAAVIRRMYEEAMAGDVKAASFLSELMGEMERKIEIKAVPKLVDDIGDAEG